MSKRTVTLENQDGSETTLEVVGTETELSLLLDRLIHLFSQVDDSYTVEDGWTYVNPKRVTHPEGKRYIANYRCPTCGQNPAMYADEITFVCPVCGSLGFDEGTPI